VEAGDGEGALQTLARERFDVVLMDVQMPHMDGFEATRRIRANEQGGEGRQRVVAMTAHAMAGDRERCLAAGMDGYVAKPIARAELYAEVEWGDEPAPGASAPSARSPSCARSRRADARGAGRRPLRRPRPALAASAATRSSPAR
jgi:two-component system sensor histidine kinase/response regulator